MRVGRRAGSQIAIFLVGSLELGSSGLAVHAAPIVRFAAPLVYAAGSQPVAVAAADLTGNGLQDLVVADRGTNSVSILRGLGGGRFAPPVSVPAGPGPDALAVADLTGNGIPDIVVADGGGSEITVLYGNGQGGVRATVHLTVPAGPQAVAVGDVNGDGIPDLVVATGNSAATRSAGGISILIGTRGGEFRPAYTLPAGFNPRTVALGALAGTSLLSIVSTSYDPRATVSILAPVPRARGLAQRTYTTGSAPIAAALGDFAENGRLDIATADYLSGTVSVFLNAGNGSFGAPANYAAGPDPEALAVADLTGSGRLDLVVADPYDQVQVLPGNGDGTFGAPLSFQTGTLRTRATQQALAVVDLLATGGPDIVTTDATAGTVSVLPNTSAG